MRKLRPFTKLPSGWLEAGGLVDFRWKLRGSDNLAGLMVLIAIAHHTDTNTGIAKISYSHLSDITGLSRAKVSDGLKILMMRRIVTREPEGRGTYGLANFDPNRGYAQLPVLGMYRNDVIEAFTEFRLRRSVELDAIKLYLTFAARRDNKRNMAFMTYDQIERYSGVRRNFIKPALTVLGIHNLIQVERFQTASDDGFFACGYRLSHLHPYRHMGTSGRSDEFEIVDVTASAGRTS